MATILGITDIIKNLHSYDVELGHVATEREKSNASVKIGGTDKQKFVPNINASKWDDESFLNINYPDAVVNTEVETFLLDKIELEVGGLTHRYFKKNARDLKYDIVIPSKPLSNHFTFNLTFSENLIFHHQDTIAADWLRISENGTRSVMGCTTLAEYEAIQNRPDNIVNSYAVYHKTSKNNKYLTGKFCHIERVKFIDAGNKEIWADQLIELTGKGTADWTITVDQAWLDNALYPITMDPVMGYNTVGGSNGEAPTDMHLFCRYAAPATGGAIDDLNCYVDRSGGGVYFIMGVYEDGSGTVESQDKLSSSESEVAAPQSPTWITDNGLTGTIVGGADHWLGLETESGLFYYYDTATAGYEDTEYQISISYDATLPDPAPSALDDTPFEMSFYINFTESVTGYTLTAESGSYGLTGTAVDLKKGSKINIDPGTFAVTGIAAGLLRGYPLSADPGSFLISGQDAGLIKDSKILMASGSYAISGQDAGLLKGSLISIESGGYDITGQDAALLRGLRIGIDSGAFGVTGQNVALLRSSKIGIESDAYSLTGIDVILTYTPITGYTLTADSGTYGLTGTAVDLLRGLRIGIESGAYSLTGQDVTLLYTPVGAYILTAEGGVYNLTGTAVDLLHNSKIGAEAGSFLLSGQNISLLKSSKISAESGIYNITGQAAALLRGYCLGIGVGNYTLSGQDVGLIKASKLQAEAGSYNLSGQAASLLRGFILELESGGYNLTGSDVALLRNAVLSAQAGSFILTGQDADLIYSGIVVKREILELASVINQILAKKSIINMDLSAESFINQSLPLTSMIELEEE